MLKSRLTPNQIIVLGSVVHFSRPDDIAGFMVQHGAATEEGAGKFVFVRRWVEDAIRLLSQETVRDWAGKISSGRYAALIAEDFVQSAKRSQRRYTLVLRNVPGA